MKDNSLTIVIPCYNGWKYMSKCLDSLENQTVQPDKIIIIDDCSTDDSVKRVEEYISSSKLDMQIIKNEKNVGPGQSRANAVKYVQTEYVAFGDCDDWYELSFVEDIKNNIIKDNPDLIIFDNYITSDNSKKKAEETKALVGKNKREILALYAMSLWRFVVCTDLVKKVCFPPLYHAEDAAAAAQIIALSDNILVLEQAYYNYYYRSDSGSMVISDRVYKNMIEAFRVVQSRLQEDFYQECEFIGIKNVVYGASFNAFKAKITNKTIRGFLKEFKEEFPRWKKNPYFSNLPLKKRVYLSFINMNILLVPKLLANIHKNKYKQKG